MRDDGGVELLGRSAEQALLLGLLDSASGSVGSTIVLRGVAGIGKSALLGLAVTHARDRGMSVLSVTAVPTESQLPYAGIDQLLKTLLIGQPASVRGLWEAALGRAGEPAGTVERYQLARAALNSVTTSPGLGRVLVVDDAQWLDRESWDILAFIGRRIADDKVCLLLGMRDSEESEALLTGSGLPEHRIEPLSPEAAARLLETAAPGLVPPLGKRVLREAAGNPLGLIELGTAAGELGDSALSAQELPLTERLERTYALMISRLPVLTRSMILIAALDDAASLGEVLAVARGLHGPNVSVDDLDPAVAAGLLTADKEIVRFRHPLIRWTVARAATAPVRLATHAAIAGVLDGQGERQAWHRAAATVGTDADVADQLARTAQQADLRGSSEAAQRAWERSAQLTPDGPARARRLMNAAHAAVKTSQYANTASLLQQIDEDQVAAADRTELEWLRHCSDGFQWPYDQTFAVLAGIAARLQAEGRGQLTLEVLTDLSILCYWVDIGATARERLVALLEEMRLPELDPRYVGIIAIVSPIEHGKVSIERMRRLLLDPAQDVLAVQHLGSAASGVGDLRSSLAFLKTAIASTRRQGLLEFLPRSLVGQALVAALLGDVQLALTAAGEAEWVALETNQVGWVRQARLLTALARALAGDAQGALLAADESERELLTVGARPLLCQVALIRGVAHLADGRPAAALEEFLTMFEPTDLHYHEFGRLWALPHLAEAAALSGRLDRLRAVADVCTPITAKSGWPLLQAGMAYAQALLAPEEEADAAFRAALPQVSADFPFERARLQLAYGAWLRRHRRVADSRGPLRAAQQVFEALGAEPWAERARKEVRASGERPRRTQSAALTLTPQELQIARLAASGLTNPEIAEQLFLATSTISTHLHRVYAKLAVTGRKQLGPALTDPIYTD